MFHLGQQVVYGIHGVCQIVDIESRVIDRRKIEYFVLSPVDRQDAKFLIPMHNEAALAKLSPVLTKDELDQLLTTGAENKAEWIADEGHRKQRYRELLVSGDRAALIEMIRLLLIHKKEQIEAGRKFHLCDESFLKDAQKVLSNEFSLVLGIPAEAVGDYIQSKLEK